jgi:dTDP-4-dehydrorhamnose reductase
MNFVIPHPELHGTYHVAASPINKYDLLTLVANAYKSTVTLVSNEDVVIDRSLDSSRFNAATGYQPAAWPQLIDFMRLNRF